MTATCIACQKKSTVAVVCNELPKTPGCPQNQSSGGNG